ncbi:hypothetical protein [Microbacterium sp. NPDC055357]
MTTAGPSVRARQIADAMPTPRIIAPTISGDVVVHVGVRAYGLPGAAEYVHDEHEAILYVRVADAIHVLGERGELIGFRPEILEAIRRTHFP